MKVIFDNVGFVYKFYEEETIYNKISEYLIKENIIGLFQGRMEFGPRALGNRSIIADPRNPKMQKKMNLKIKFRESFRPFAPVVMLEKVAEWFDFDKESPYMLLTAEVANDKKIHVSKNSEKKVGLDKLKITRSIIPAVTHVDFSARLQTVSEKSNLFLYNILKEFNNKTNCPILINTSFNIRGEPIVFSIYDALQCFMNTEMDILVIGSYILEKDIQPNILSDENYKNKFELD